MVGESTTAGGGKEMDLGRREVEVRRRALDHLHDEDAQRPDVHLGAVVDSLNHLRSLGIIIIIIKTATGEAQHV
jgi:hypothetical protein